MLLLTSKLLLRFPLRNPLLPLDLPERRKLSVAYLARRVFGVIGACGQGCIFPCFAIIFSGMLKAFAEPDADKKNSDINYWACMFIVIAICMGIANLFQTTGYINVIVIHSNNSQNQSAEMACEATNALAFWTALIVRVIGLSLTNLVHDLDCLKGGDILLFESSSATKAKWWFRLSSDIEYESLLTITWVRP